jgi:hypothetical protein
MQIGLPERLVIVIAVEDAPQILATDATSLRVVVDALQLEAVALSAKHF